MSSLFKMEHALNSFQHRPEPSLSLQEENTACQPRAKNDGNKHKYGVLSLIHI